MFHRGDRLRKAREEARLSVAEMAARLGVERGTITRYERNRGVRKLVVEAYARHTGYSFGWLETGDDSPEGPVTTRYSYLRVAA